jgi:hypothetical protein
MAPHAILYDLYCSGDSSSSGQASLTYTCSSKSEERGATQEALYDLYCSGKSSLTPQNNQTDAYSSKIEELVAVDGLLYDLYCSGKSSSYPQPNHAGTKIDKRGATHDPLYDLYCSEEPASPAQMNKTITSSKTKDDRGIVAKLVLIGQSNPSHSWAIKKASQKNWLRSTNISHQIPESLTHIRVPRFRKALLPCP